MEKVQKNKVRTQTGVIRRKKAEEIICAYKCDELQKKT